MTPKILPKFLVANCVSDIPSTTTKRILVLGDMQGFKARSQDVHYTNNQLIELANLVLQGEEFRDLDNWIFVAPGGKANPAAIATAAFLILYQQNDNKLLVDTLRSIVVDSIIGFIPNTSKYEQLGRGFGRLAMEITTAIKTLQLPELVEILKLNTERITWTESETKTFEIARFYFFIRWIIDAIEGDRDYPGYKDVSSSIDKIYFDAEKLKNENRLKILDGVLFARIKPTDDSIDCHSIAIAANELKYRYNYILIHLNKNSIGESSKEVYQIIDLSGNLVSSGIYKRLSRKEAVKRLEILLDDHYKSFPTSCYTKRQLPPVSLNFEPWAGNQFNSLLQIDSVLTTFEVFTEISFQQP